MDKLTRLIQGILDKHTIRKNAMSHGIGPPCACEDCIVLNKMLEIVKKCRGEDAG